jgi:hypothetical protein
VGFFLGLLIIQAAIIVAANAGSSQSLEGLVAAVFLGACGALVISYGEFVKGMKR